MQHPAGHRLGRALAWVRAVAAGILGACAFPVVVPGPGSGPGSGHGTLPILDGGPRELLILLCALMLFRMVEGSGPMRRRVGHAALAGVCHFAILIYWIDIALARYGGLPQWLAVIILGLFVCWCATFWAALPLLHAALVRRLRVPAVLAFPVAVVGLEWLRSVALTGFPWGLWGYSQARNLPLLQWASIGGVFAVSFLIALVAALLARYLQCRNTVAVAPAAAWLLGVVALIYVGGFVMLHRDGGEVTGVLRIGVLQASIGQDIKNDRFRYADSIVDDYSALANQAVAAGAEVVVWPEAAWPTHLRLPLDHPWLKAVAVPQLMGATTYAAGKPAEGHNSALWVEPGGKEGGVYHKRHLVPFGEYVPMRWLLPVDRVVPGMVDFVAGVSADPIGPQRWGLMICYDGVFPELARASVRSGAQLLANLTNDGWYGLSSAPYQHRDFYVLRAVETGRWVVRAANNGISVFVDPKGRLLHATSLNERTAIVGDVVLRRGATFYVWAGDWWLAICLGLSLAAAAVGIGGMIARSARRSGRRGSPCVDHDPPDEDN